MAFGRPRHVRRRRAHVVWPLDRFDVERSHQRCYLARRHVVANDGGGRAAQPGDGGRVDPTGRNCSWHPVRFGGCSVVDTDSGGRMRSDRWCDHDVLRASGHLACSRPVICVSHDSRSARLHRNTYGHRTCGRADRGRQLCRYRRCVSGGNSRVARWIQLELRCSSVCGKRSRRRGCAGRDDRCGKRGLDASTPPGSR